MSRVTSFCMMIAVILVASGCQQVVTITSEPTGATVLIDGRESGHTPLRVVLGTDRSHRVTVTMLGYASKTVEIRRVKRKPILAPGLSTLSTGFSLVRAAATGNPAGLLVGIYARLLYDRYAYDLEPRRIGVTLDST